MFIYVYIAYVCIGTYIFIEDYLIADGNCAIKANISDFTRFAKVASVELFHSPWGTCHTLQGAFAGVIVVVVVIVMVKSAKNI